MEARLTRISPFKEQMIADAINNTSTFMVNKSVKILGPERTQQMVSKGISWLSAMKKN